jgi:hypothetical protein
VFIDGELIPVANYTFVDTSIPVEGVTNLYVNATIEPGDHTLRVVGPQAVEKKFAFTK